MQAGYFEQQLSAFAELPPEAPEADGDLRGIGPPARLTSLKGQMAAYLRGETTPRSASHSPRPRSACSTPAPALTGTPVFAATPHRSEHVAYLPPFHTKSSERSRPGGLWGGIGWGDGGRVANGGAAERLLRSLKTFDSLVSRGSVTPQADAPSAVDSDLSTRSRDLATRSRATPPGGALSFCLSVCLSVYLSLSGIKFNRG